MLILSEKLLILFYLIYFTETTTLAQPPDFLSYFCDNESNYTINGTYQKNLETALSTLPTTNSGFGFYNISIGQGSNTVNSIALCRGDVNLDVCQTCLNDSIVKLRQICPNQKEAIGYYDYCLLKYSNQTILKQTGFRFYVYLANPQNSTDANQFNEDLRPLMNKLRNEAAAGDSLRKFASGNTTGPGLSNIYALVQCTPDLSEFQCNTCLEDSINKITEFFNGRVGGRILLPMCNFRYEIYGFFNQSSNLVVPPPPPPPIIQTSPGIEQPSPPGKKKNTTQIMIIVVVIVTVIVVILIASFCIFMRLQKKKKQTPQSLPLKSGHTETSMDIGTAESLQYNFSTIKTATNDFSKDNKLGRGGFGAVYKGRLGDGHEIVVKWLARDSGQGDVEF